MGLRGVPTRVYGVPTPATRRQQMGDTMSMVRRQEFGATVICTSSGQETWTRAMNGVEFCADCGATDHAKADA